MNPGAKKLHARGAAVACLELWPEYQQSHCRLGLDSEDYDECVKPASRKAIGARAILANLKENSDLTHSANPTETDYSRLEKYQRAIRGLIDGGFV